MNTPKPRGRAVPLYRPGRNARGDISIPAHDLTLADGRTLTYHGRLDPVHVGGNVYLTLSRYTTDDGLLVMASLNPLPHAEIKSKDRFFHVSISRADCYPDWDEQIMVVEAFVGTTLDMAMVKPRRSDYIALHPYCFHWWELPQEWGLW